MRLQLLSEIKSLLRANWLLAWRDSIWTMISLESKLFKWLERKSCLRHQLKSIRWFQWLMKIALLIITTKDGCGFSSLGVQLMFTLISQISWNCSRVAALKVVILASIFQLQKKMNWQRQLSKFFMLLNRGPKRVILTVTNLWTTLNLQVWLISQWRKKRPSLLSGHPKKSKECFPQ